MALSIKNYEIEDRVAVQLFSAYDEFIGMMSDKGQREHLKTLKAEQSRSDELFQQVRRYSQDFEDALRQVFFENQFLADVIKKYGVF